MTSKIWLKYIPKNLLGKSVSLLILMKLFSLFLPFEFSNNDFRESFKFYHNAILIVLLFVFSLVEILSDKSGLKIWVRVLLFFPLVAAFLITVIVVLFLGYCKYEEVGILYVEKNGNATISRRSLNCGATTDYSYDTYYIKPITPFFNFRWKFDDENIDKSKWIKPSN
jgi:hypothetical protein